MAATAPEEAELEEIMARIRAELSGRREVMAAALLAMDALPSRYDEFAALPDDAFIEAAYRVALGRSPTPEEREKAAWQVRGQMTRAVMLERMLALPEAKARGAAVSGVTRQAFLDRVARVVRESGGSRRWRAASPAPPSPASSPRRRPNAPPPRPRHWRCCGTRPARCCPSTGRRRCGPRLPRRG